MKYLSQLSLTLLAICCSCRPGLANEPTNAGEAAAKKAAQDAAASQKFAAWKATLTPEQQAWETVLEQNLGGFYLPIYQREKVAGKVTAWDYVKDDPKLPRVLLIGDSVSRGYTLAVRKALAGQANVHRAPENCGPTANGLKKLDVWLAGGKWDVIHFNFGIHDRATKPSDYEQRLDTIVTRLQATGAKVIWASTTPVPPDTKDGPAATEAIVERNRIAAQVMAKHGVAIDDLYGQIQPRLAEFQNAKDVHFNEAGYEFLGKQVASEIRSALKTPQSTSTSAIPRVFGLDPQQLVETHQRAAAGDATATAMIASLRRDADKLLKNPLWTVTDKPLPAPSGDRHDYVSLATYYWPNPNTSNGLPYFSRDGVVNPEGKEYDFPRLRKMCDAVQTLSLAYYLTGQEIYARHAARQIQAWFLDEATRMNAHLNFGQLIKGRNTGSPFGIIDTSYLPMVLDGVGMLEGSSAWSAADQTRLQAWFRDYLTWLLTSALGQREGNAENNHGTWYDVQTVSFALFVGEESRARQICEAAKLRRIARQIEPDGTMPRELKRTRSLGYTLYNLRAMLRLARLAERLDVDLWNYQSPDGRSLRKALDFLAPYADPQKAWPYPQIEETGRGDIVVALHQAAQPYGDSACQKVIDQFATGKLRTSRKWLFNE